jgi:hypothetical protein
VLIWLRVKIGTIVNERRLEAVVVGPGAPGLLKVMFGRDNNKYVTEVPVERVPSSLRLPNASFVAVVVGRDLVPVETAGRAWIEVQDQIRIVLNAVWDPIGVAGAVDDEYDPYIAGIYSLLQNGASEDMIATHLVSIEVEQMEVGPSPLNKRLAVAAALWRLQLPAMPGPSSAA